MPNTTKEDVLLEIGKPGVEDSVLWIEYRIPAEYNSEEDISGSVSYVNNFGWVLGDIVIEEEYKYLTLGMKLWVSYYYAAFSFKTAETGYSWYTHVGMSGPLDSESSIYEWMDIKASLFSNGRIEDYFSVEYNSIDDYVTITPLVTQEVFEQLTGITDAGNMPIYIFINWYDGTMSNDTFLNTLEELSSKNENFYNSGIRWTGGISVKPWTDNDEIVTFDLTDFYGNPFKKTIRIITHANVYNE